MAQLKVAPSLGSPATTQARPAAAASAPAAAPATEYTSAQVEAFEIAGRNAATIWLTQLDNGMWGESWDQASRLFRSNVPLSVWMDNMPKDRGSLGRATERTISDSVFRSQMTGQPDGAYVTVLFNTKFPNKEPMEELVATMREPDGRWRVVGYSKR